MANVYELRLTGNCTDINGTLIRIPVDVGQQGPASNSTTEEDDYDHKGAMQFIVATVLVYSICGVLCTLVNRMKRLRGKSHRAYIQDEHVQRYLKSEKVLKFDGRRAKMLYDCGRVVRTVARFEERQRLREIGREIVSGDFVRARDENINRKKKKKKKRDRRRSVEGTLGHIGLSLFYIPENSNIEDMAALTSADETAALMTKNNETDVQTKEEYPGIQIKFTPKEAKPDVVDLSEFCAKGENFGTSQEFHTKGENSGPLEYTPTESGSFARDVTDVSIQMQNMEYNDTQTEIPITNRDSQKLSETILDIEKLEIAYADD